MLTLNFQHAYTFLITPFIVVWLLLYIFGRRTRREQLVISLLFTPIGPLSEILHFYDYWKPASILSFNIGTVSIFIEDLVFAFCIAGIGSVIHEVITGNICFERNYPKRRLTSVIIFAIAGAATLSLFLLGLNSIFAFSVGFLITAFLMISKRKDLFLNSLIGGFALASIMFISYLIVFKMTLNYDEIFKMGWLLYGTPLDIRILGIPLTEMIWAFTGGMAIGPFYEFWNGLECKRQNH